MLFGNFRDLHLPRVQIFLAIGIIFIGVRTLEQEGAFAPPPWLRKMGENL